MAFTEEAEKKAQANLEMVMKAVGAKYWTTNSGRCTCSLCATQVAVEITLNTNRFRIHVGNISLVSIYNGGVIESTCFTVTEREIPSDEWIASALLLLHRDPSLFWQWKKRDDWYA